MPLIRNFICLALLSMPVPLPALDAPAKGSYAPSGDPYLDPAFQNYAETTDGYLNPRHAPGAVRDFRDSPSSFPAPAVRAFAGASAAEQGRGARSQPAVVRSTSAAAWPARSAPKPPPGRHYKVTFAGESGPISSYVGPLGQGAASGFKMGDYTFVSILPRAADIPSVIKALAEEGFRFSGEKTFFTPEGRKTLIMGWASYSRLDRITKNPLVLRTAVESKPSGSQFRARIRFTLRAPGGENSAVFVEDFVRNLGSSAGFSAENVSRVPAASGPSKFTAFEVTGSIPLEMIGSVSMSPFVAAVELQDQSL